MAIIMELSIQCDPSYTADAIPLFQEKPIIFTVAELALGKEGSVSFQIMCFRANYGK